MSVRLAIEISNPSSWEVGDPLPGLALGEVSPSSSTCTMLGEEAIDPTRPHDDDLMPALDRLCVRVGVKPGQIESIAVSVGPGGFTATRVAVTTAKCLAAAVGAQCIAVPSALVAAQQAMESEAEWSSVLVLLAAKGTSVYAQMVKRGEMAGEGAAIEAANLALEGVEMVLADRFAQVALEARRFDCAAMDIRIQRPMFTPGGLLMASRGLPAVMPTRLLPLYPREPEAVTKWRALKAARKK